MLIYFQRESAAIRPVPVADPLAALEYVYTLMWQRDVRRCILDDEHEGASGFYVFVLDECRPGAAQQRWHVFVPRTPAMDDMVTLAAAVDQAMETAS